MNSVEPPRVLVVDDDAAISRLLLILLQSENLLVRLAKNGLDALEALSEFTPDLVLLDLQMPVMDGRTFYRQFRSRGYDTPVILLSAFSVEAAQQDLGAEGAIAKPFDPIQVGLAVEHFLEHRR